MKRLVSVLMVFVVVLAGGCVGTSASLSSEKIRDSLNNVKTGEYSLVSSVNATYLYQPLNLSGKWTELLTARGVFHRSKNLSAGNLTLRLNTTLPEGTVNLSVPYFINGSEVYMKLHGEWQEATPITLKTSVKNETLTFRTRITSATNVSSQLNYLEKILESKNVTLNKTDNGYYLFVRLTGDELAPLFSGNTSGVTVKGGWLEANFTKEGTPYYMGEHAEMSVSGKGFLVNMTVNMKITLKNINEPIEVEIPSDLREFIKRQKLLEPLEDMKSYRSNLTLRVECIQNLTPFTYVTTSTSEVLSWVNENGSVSHVLVVVEDPLLGGRMVLFNSTISEKNGRLTMTSDENDLFSIENVSWSGRSVYSHLTQEILLDMLLHSNFTMEKTDEGYRVYLNLTNTPAKFFDFVTSKGKALGTISTGENAGVTDFNGYLEANFTAEFLPVSYRIHATYTLRNGFIDAEMIYDLTGRFWDVNGNIELPKSER